MASQHPRAENYRVLTFDCYGTLVDWSSGIVDHLQPVLRGHNREASDMYLLEFFARTNRQLGVSFSHIITAEDVGLYKPNRAMFDAAFATLGDRSRVLHVAQSLFHDIAPAGALGIDTVWIRRDHNAARVVDAQPTWSYATLGAFAQAILGNSV